MTPTVLDTVGSVGKAELLGRNHGRKKSSRSTLTSLENSGLPSVVVQGLRGSPYSVCDVGQDGNKGHAPDAVMGRAPDAALKLVKDFTRLSHQGRGGFCSPQTVPETQSCTFCALGCHCIGPSCRGQLWLYFHNKLLLTFAAVKSAHKTTPAQTTDLNRNPYHKDADWVLKRVLVRIAAFCCPNRYQIWICEIL